MTRSRSRTIVAARTAVACIRVRIDTHAAARLLARRCTRIARLRLACLNTTDGGKRVSLVTHKAIDHRCAHTTLVATGDLGSQSTPSTARNALALETRPCSDTSGALEHIPILADHTLLPGIAHTITLLHSNAGYEHVYNTEPSCCGAETGEVPPHPEPSAFLTHSVFSV
jgi:hypothetical protein